MPQYLLYLYLICYRQFIEEKFNELLYEPSGEFHNFCRMSYNDFEFLLQKISPLISKQDTDFRDAIPAKFRLAITLRFFASGEVILTKAYTICLKYLSL